MFRGKMHSPWLLNRATRPLSLILEMGLYFHGIVVQYGDPQCAGTQFISLQRSTTPNLGEDSQLV